LLFAEMEIECAACSRANGAEVISPGQRHGCHPQMSFSALKGRRAPAPLQGAQQLSAAKNQGVALGWHTPALSAPEEFDSVQT
jgi:hypothetical protein